jgi:hypothetical protein
MTTNTVLIRNSHCAEYLDVGGMRGDCMMRSFRSVALYCDHIREDGMGGTYGTHGEIATRLHDEQLKNRVSTPGRCKEFFSSPHRPDRL